jgi:ribosomal subunit interface protein
MTLSWNVVAKKIHPHEQLQAKLREKVSKLERYLQHFPPDAVHLQVALDRQPKNGRFTVGLTLRVPSNILRSEKTAADPIPALDQAIRALLRELSSLKSTLRHEADWKRRGRNDQAHQAKPLQFAPTPLPAGQGPQSLGEVVRDMVQQHYASLLFHIRSRIDAAVSEGALPQHAIDAEAVADEVVRQAESRPQSKPAEQTYRVWLFSLARRELDRRLRDFRDQAVSTISLNAEETSRFTEIDSGGAGDLNGRFAQPFEPEELETGDLTPDGHSVSPDAAAVESDLVAYLRGAAQKWPAEERDVFQLHFLEGFEPDEVAMLEKLSTAEVKLRVAEIQLRLRDLVAEAARINLRATAGLRRPLTPSLTNRLNRGK